MFMMHDSLLNLNFHDGFFRHLLWETGTTNVETRGRLFAFAFRLRSLWRKLQFRFLTDSVVIYFIENRPR
jgi:hypothetical protein